jgi:uncharacterized membrane protein
MFLGIILAIAPVIGMVLGFVALSEIKRNPAARGRGVALAGVIVGIVGSAWWIYVWTDLVFHNFYGH